ncbi:MAG: hypothetical protein ACRC5T_13955, partial [Cetobacterium sp.]
MDIENGMEFVKFFPKRDDNEPEETGFFYFYRYIKIEKTDGRVFKPCKGSYGEGVNLSVEMLTTWREYTKDVHKSNIKLLAINTLAVLLSTEIKDIKNFEFLSENVILKNVKIFYNTLNLEEKEMFDNKCKMEF